MSYEKQLEDDNAALVVDNIGLRECLREALKFIDGLLADEDLTVVGTRLRSLVVLGNPIGNSVDFIPLITKSWPFSVTVIRGLAVTPMPIS